MREIDLLHRQVELVTVSIGARVRRIHDALEGLAFYTKHLFAHGNAAPEDVDRWLEEERFEVLETGFYESRDRVERARANGALLGESTRAWGATVKDHAETRRRLYLMRELTPQISKIHSQIKGVAWIYYTDAGTPHATMVTPGLAPDSMIPSDFDWHTYHSFAIVKPEANPERAIRWSPPNVDYAGQGLISCVSIPLYRDDELLGVWTMDVPLASLHADLAFDALGAMGKRQTSFIADYAGRLIAHPALDPSSQGEKGSLYDLSLKWLGGDFATIDINALKEKGSGDFELTNAEGERLFVAYRTVPEIGWVVFATFPTADMVEASQAAFQRAFERLGAGDLSFRLDATGDETMRRLVSSYNEMAETLQESLRRRAEAEAERRRLATEQERLGRELEIAASIQLAMLPKLPAHPEYEFAGKMEPASEVGGDFYDILSRGDDLWITIGDVSSHGLGAGLVMMITQAAYQAVFDAAPQSTADEVLRRVNRVVHTSATTRLGGGRYVTGQVLLHRGDGAFECAGGHLWPLVVEPRSGEVRRVESVGPWLGIVPILPHVPVHRFTLEPGEVLCLYSDGIVEARNASGETYDLERLTRSLARNVGSGLPLQDCADAILAEVESFTDQRDDDRTVLLVRRKA